jgi:type I restriction enzyme S subunit
MKQVPLRDVVQSYIGGGWGKESPDQDHAVAASVIRGTDLDAVQSGVTDSVPYRWHKASNARSRSLCAGDIVFEVSGGSKDQPVGRSLLLNGARLAKFPALVIPASFCKRITPKQERVHPRFLHAHLQLAWADRRIVQWQVQSTGISNFNFEAFLDDFLIELPPLPIQRRIASILSAYDDLIDNSQRRIQILEAMARALYREWFVHFRFPGHEKHPRVASALGEIPEGWDVIPFERLLASMTGGDWGGEQPEDRETEAVVVVRGTDFNDVAYGGHLRAPVRYIKLSSLVSRALKVGDVIIENSINAKSRSVGTTLLVDEHVLSRLGQDAIAASFCKVLRPRDFRVAPLIHLHARHLREDARMEYYQNVAANGIANFQAQKFAKEEHLVLPADEDERSRLIAPIGAVLQNVASLASRLANLRHTRDLLLPRLLSGQIALDELEAA